MNSFVRGPAGSNKTLQLLQQRIEIKYKTKFENYFDLHRWSVDNYELLWAELWDFHGIICSEYFSQVIEPGKTMEEVPKWFLGSRLNYAENMLRHQDNKLALILDGEECETVEKLSFADLRNEVSLLSAALRKSGVTVGDTIACYISNRKEAITSMLAAASIGAQYSAANPLIGVKALLSRFKQVKPKVLFTIHRHLCDKIEVDYLSKLPDIVEGLPSLELVIIVPSRESSLLKDIYHIKNSVFLPDFLQRGLDKDGKIPLPKYEQLSFNHPFIVNFTSGTTGDPKGIVHSAGASLLAPLITNTLMFNSKPSDIMYTIHSTGWVSWNVNVAALAAGSALLIYEGVPFFKYGNKFWDLIQDHNITFAFLTPGVLEQMEKNNIVPENHNLENLHTIITGSCPVKPHTFDFVHNRIKRDIFFSLAYGSTEYMMMAYGINHNLPVYKTEMQASAIGLNIKSYNEKGESVLDKSGELVITTPFPSMPIYFFNDDNFEKYKSAFFGKFPGVWCHGDVCTINSRTNGLIVHGRSDETIKQRGARFGSSEIYSIVNQISEVSDCLCISRLNYEGDEIAILFIKMKHCCEFTDAFIKSIRNLITSELSNLHVPDVILEVKDIPYNVNGKKLEVLVKKIFSQPDKVSTDAAVNPECLAEYIHLAENIGT